ncbi:transposase (plasmid) [Rhizobium oryzihabitans]|uniref:Transposase n=1 Tax=Rhizobium oryzihabitans TaxID=2267833 RepID=A0A7L5BLI2_9HYPH|nr:transposase [Rhizobium oryzihabitans]
MSFALCHLVGFQIVPRLRGFKDRKLYLFRATHLPKTLHRSLATHRRRAEQGKLERHPAAGHDDPVWAGSAFDPVGKAVRIPTPERTDVGATRSRSHQSVHLSAPVVAEPRNAQERDGRPQQERIPEHLGPCAILQPSRRTARQDLRESILPGVRAEPADQCHRLLEHSLSRTGLRPTQPGGYRHAARPSQTHHPARVATHQSHWRLHLDLDGKPRSQAATARNIHPRSVITIRSQKSDRFNTFVS